MTPEKRRRFMEQFELARKQVEQLRRLYLHCFDAQGRAIVAVAAFPRIKEPRT